MWSLITAAGGLGTLLTLVVWLVKAYTIEKETKATLAERQAGADARDVEATNAEINRTNRAADAGAAAGKLFDTNGDPNDLGGK